MDMSDAVLIKEFRHFLGDEFPVARNRNQRNLLPRLGLIGLGGFGGLPLGWLGFAHMLKIYTETRKQAQRDYSNASNDDFSGNRCWQTEQVKK